MAAGITARQYTNNAVFTEKTTMFEVSANNVATVAEDLIEFAVDAMGGSLPSAILLSNKSATTVYIRPAGLAGAAGIGIAISSLGSMFFPMAAVPTEGIYVETLTDIYAIGFE